MIARLETRPSGALAALSAAALAALVAGLYLALTVNQGDGSGTRVAFIAGFIAAAAWCLVATVSVRDRRVGLASSAFAAGALVIVTLLGAASIGFLLVVPAFLALRATRLAMADLAADTVRVITPIAAMAALLVAAIGLIST